MRLRIFLALTLVASRVLAASGGAPLPRYDHIVIVIEENKAFSQIVGNPEAPFINVLAARGVLFLDSHGIAHPSQPNYLALFSGSTQGVDGNGCPLELKGGNLAESLLARGLSFVSYAESMPEAGYAGCMAGAYMRKHNPVANWKALEALNRPFGDFPADFAQLPTVALVVPDQRNDMHDGSIAEGDAWLKRHVEAYAQWAPAHNSLLIVTWDEDNGSADNHIATIFLGAQVRLGTSAQRIDHYNLLRTIEEMYGLPYLGRSAGVPAVDGVWRKPATVRPVR